MVWMGAVAWFVMVKMAVMAPFYRRFRGVADLPSPPSEKWRVSSTIRGEVPKKCAGEITRSMKNQIDLGLTDQSETPW
jgi:hypothetical protein